jgi:hypothetical protein
MNPNNLEFPNTAKQHCDTVFGNRIGYGVFQIEPNKAIRIKVNNDFVNYYLWLVNRRFYGDTGKNFVNNDKYSTQRSGAHISVVLCTFHKWNPDWNNLKFDKVMVPFYYRPDDIRYGGPKFKGWSNFWLPVDCPMATDLKRTLGIKDNDNFLGDHVTLCSNKSEFKNRQND